MAIAMNLGSGVRAQRKTLITVAEWNGASYYVYTLVTSQPAEFDPTEYYKKVGDEYVKGTAGDTWNTNTWYTQSSSTTYREILGVRTEDSSIEFNADIATSTDVLGITYTDVNKTEPQQTFDPYYLIGGSALGEYLADAALRNDIAKYNGAFTVYIIAAFLNDGAATPAEYRAVKHTGCSIIPTALGGDAYNSMPIEVHFSNNLTVGTVNKLGDDFVFSPESAS